MMMTTLVAKYEQNKHAKEHLKATGTKHIVECNQHDTFWSCGQPMYSYHKLEEDRQMWKGQNILGKMLES
jgi:predicted NAD-dependent protein-ADP-ribosyltransferase YbiA (DUF1768 family)